MPFLEHLLLRGLAECMGCRNVQLSCASTVAFGRGRKNLVSVYSLKNPYRPIGTFTTKAVTMINTHSVDGWAVGYAL